MINYQLVLISISNFKINILKQNIMHLLAIIMNFYLIDLKIF